MNSELPVQLEFSHVTKSYAALAALDDVSLAIHRGAVHAVVGEAGAGKTTLMKILGGFIRAGDYSGEVRLEGEPLAFRSPSDALKRGIAIVPRKFTVLENSSVADNITLASWQLRKSFWVSRGAEAERSRQLLEEWSIDIDIDAPVASLAPLQKRLLMIARALAIDPKLIVLDEPLADVPGFHASAQLLRFVRRLGEHGMTCSLPHSARGRCHDGCRQDHCPVRRPRGGDLAGTRLRQGSYSRRAAGQPGKSPQRAQRRFQRK